MKTIIIYIFISVISIAWLSGQVIEHKEIELFKKYGVKERVKYDYKYTNGKMAKQGLKSNTNVYNRDGLVLNVTSYSGDGDVSRQEKFGYDQNGNRIMYERKSMRGDYKKDTEYDDEKVILETGHDGSAAFKTVYKYNNANRVAEIEYYSDNLFLIEEKRIYKYTGNKAVVQILAKGKTLKSTVNLVFNSSNQIIEETYLSLEGVELEKRMVTYNSNGNLSKEEKYRGGKRAYTTFYVYNAKGELVKLIEDTPSKGKFDKKLYTYDVQGRVIEYKWTRKPGQEFNVKTFKYGSNGVCSEEHTLYPATDYQILSKYEYSFY